MLTLNQAKLAKDLLSSYGTDSAISRNDVVKWCQERGVPLMQWFLSSAYRTGNRGEFSLKKLQENYDTTFGKCQASENNSLQKDIAVGVVPENMKKYSVYERFEMAGKILGVVIESSNINSAIICGRGGIGKTKTVTDMLDYLGYVKTFSGNKDIRNAYIHIKGMASPMGLYRLLYENKESLLVLDDADNVLDTENSRNILKAVLSDGVREVFWHSAILDKEDTPNSFIFNGKVIFISNRTIEKFPQPIASRSMLIDLNMTDDELIDHMMLIGTEMFSDSSDMTEDMILECVEHIQNNKSRIKDLSLRTLLKVGAFREQDEKHWKELSLYAI